MHVEEPGTWSVNFAMYNAYRGQLGGMFSSG